MALFFLAFVQPLEPLRAEPSEPIKIGVVYAFTGGAQVWSEYGRMGLELAKDEINAEGGINGRPIQLIYEDSRTIPAQSVSGYRKLVALDKVPIVIGNVWEFITNPMVPLATRDKVLLISPTVMHESVEITSEYFFTLGHSVAGLEQAIGLFFEKNPQVKRLGLTCWDDPWGEAQRGLWRKVAKEHGVEIVVELCADDFTNEFRTEVARFAASKVDAVFASHLVERVLQRMREQKFQVPVLSTGNILEGIKASNIDRTLFDGVYFTNWEATPEWQEKFRKKYNKDPIVEAHLHYETLHSIAKALKSGESDLLRAIKAVKYAGVGGELDFGHGSFVNNTEGKLYQVSKNGDYQEVQ